MRSEESSDPARTLPRWKQTRAGRKEEGKGGGRNLPHGELRIGAETETVPCFCVSVSESVCENEERELGFWQRRTAPFVFLISLLVFILVISLGELPQKNAWQNHKSHFNAWLNQQLQINAWS
jgi:hypothetical protein